MTEPKKRKVEYSRDPEVWLKWLEEISDEDANIDENIDVSDQEEENVTIESDHQSESEQNISENDLTFSDNEFDSEDHEIGNIRSKFYTSKDGQNKWQKTRPPINVRTRSHNIITHLPGPRRDARNAKTEIAALELFLDDRIISVITSSTNIYIENVRQNFARDRDARSTDETEIKAFIGLLYLIGTLRCSRKNISSLWDNSKGNGLESCYLTMSQQRFRFLLRCIRFDNVNDRNARREIDKMAPIREVFELFVNNFERHYSPSEYLTIDEQLLAFRGRCSFRQYIPNKPSKYGIKTFALVDAKTAYYSKT